MKTYFGVIKKYAQFRGRATRREFWLFVLVNAIVSAVLSFVASLFFLSGVSLNILFQIPVLSIPQLIVGAVLSLYELFVFLPSLAVMVRRLHDTGRSWKFMFINLVPVLGQLMYIIVLATKDTHGRNQYGASPAK
jgi:uncharacterized membrane protein YhaH (DUF805 family)